MESVRGWLAAKVVLVTGGGSGIGRASCALFALEGARVVVAGWCAEAAGEMAAAMRSVGGDAIATSGDVALAADVERMVAETVAGFGRFDVLMANAGQALVADVLETDEAQWDRVPDSNLNGRFLCAKAPFTRSRTKPGRTRARVRCHCAEDSYSACPSSCCTCWIARTA